MPIYLLSMSLDSGYSQLGSTLHDSACLLINSACFPIASAWLCMLRPDVLGLRTPRPDCVAVSLSLCSPARPVETSHQPEKWRTGKYKLWQMAKRWKARFNTKSRGGSKSYKRSDLWLMKCSMYRSLIGSGFWNSHHIADILTVPSVLPLSIKCCEKKYWLRFLIWSDGERRRILKGLISFPQKTSSVLIYFIQHKLDV